MTKQTYEQWFARAREAAGQLWCYSDLPNDDPQSAHDAYERGDDPAVYIKELGEDLGLINFNEPWGVM